MLNRSTQGNTSRPTQPQRSVSGTLHQSISRPTYPPKWSDGQSSSGLSQYVDLTADGSNARNAEVWQQNKERVGSGANLKTTWNGEGYGEARPRKKLKLDNDGALAESSIPHQEHQEHEGGTESQQDVDDAHTIIPGKPLDFPARISTKPTRGMRKTTGDDSSRKSEGVSPPAMATRLPAPKMVADFTPWTGLNPEDILNEQVIKTGYFDKPPGPGQNESNSARQTIWPNLSQKNHYALNTLSQIFAQVLDRRQTLAKCTVPSSFKPPPRVTVTDTKREAWLKDLANTNIPLRRQSRTIPHGIRGKLLMEQCLAKSIPLQRAVWLAKCVGANELRSFRRKGVSGSAAAQGETKWVRDWTLQVEQFLETVADARGQENWRMKIDYAIKLTSAFYSEGLLDRDEYLHWLVRTFASVSLETLPLWIIIVQIYWRDLTMFGRRGRRLATAILEHLHVVTERNHPALDPLKTRLQKLVAVLAAHSKGCLVLPSTWEKYNKLLQPKELSLANEALESAVTDVSRRNEFLSRQMGRTAENTRSPSLGLYTLLDNIDLGVDMAKLTSSCQEVMPNEYELVRAILHWSSTVYRRGHARIYIAAGVIATLRDAGHDTDGAVLSYIRNPTSALPSEARQVWAVIGELVRHEQFATGAYLQWIIASGALYSSDKTSLATGLLSELPVERMPQRLRNLRDTLLARLEQGQDEELSVEMAKNEVDSLLASHTRFADRTEWFASLSGSAKLTVGDYVRIKVIEMAKVSTMSFSVFESVRGLLEQFGDISALTTLVESAYQTDDVRLLASVADTVNMHALAFAVLDFFKVALDQLIERHKDLRSHTLDRTFLLALTALVERCPDRTQIAKLLKSDLVAFEQQNSAAVCSPASDNLVGMQAGNLDSDAEIDAVFASGNSMDEQTMQRVFLRVIERADKADAEVAEHECSVGRWLNQLRTVDGPGFEKLAKDYVAATFQRSQAGPVSASGITAIVAGRCLGLNALVAGAGQSAKAAAVMLMLLAAPIATAGLSTSEAYAFNLQRQSFCNDQPGDVADLLRKAAEDSTFMFEEGWVLDLILRTITSHPGKLFKSFTDNQPSSAVRQAAARICKALLSQGQQQPSPAELDPCQVIRSADALNAPFSVGWLRVYMHLQTGTPANEEAVKKALLSAVAEKSQVWPQLLSAARPESLGDIHVWARGQILATIPTSQEDGAHQTNESPEQLCEVLDVTYRSTTAEDDAPILALLVDKIKAQEKMLNTLATTEQDYQGKLQAVVRSMGILLHLCILPAQATAISEGAKQARMHTLAALCALSVNPRLQMHTSLVDHIYDVAGLYADALPEEMLATLSRQLATTDPGIIAVIGTASTTASTYPNVVLASRAQPAQTQQQRALARQQQQRQTPQTPSVANGGAARPGPQATRGQLPELKYTSYPLRNWEILPDSTPVMGENDCAISLGLFGARKV